MILDFKSFSVFPVFHLIQRLLLVIRPACSAAASKQAFRGTYLYGDHPKSAIVVAKFITKEFYILNPRFKHEKAAPL